MASAVLADVNINILAVNATDQQKDKDIKSYLPKELSGDDILDAGGLTVDYDVSQAAYYVYGTVGLAPKESRTFKIRVRDVWKISDEQVTDIKKQIDDGFSHVQNTDYAKTAEVRKEDLARRLDTILAQQSSATDVGKRIDNYRVYSKELEKVRNNALSVNYWRGKPDEPTTGVVKFIIDLENPTDKATVNKQPTYLPLEVKPEHIIDAQGFEYKYDAQKGQPYLSKEEELAPGEKKHYEVTLADIWKVPQTEIDNLKERTRKAYDLLKKTEYADSAKYLVDNIKTNLTKIEDSQAQQRSIKEHISAFRTNQEYFKSAQKDVESLEHLLQAVRENLERSILKNVLQKIKSLKDISQIAEAIIGTKPSINNAWKIITGIVIFVAIFTGLHFAIWGRRSRDAKLKKLEEDKKKV